MSGYALLKILMVPSASVAWAQLYQMTSPSFLAAGTILLFHSAIAVWNFTGAAEASDGGCGPTLGTRACAPTVAGAMPTSTSADDRARTSAFKGRILIPVLLPAIPERRSATRAGALEPRVITGGREDRSP